MPRDSYTDLQYIVEAALTRPDIVVAPAMFKGKLVADDSKPDCPWAYLEVEKGIPKSAFEALQHLGIPCEPRYDSPHVTVIKNDEAKNLQETFGEGWKEAVTSGQDEFVFQITEMIDLDPIGWDEMDRVWFLRLDSPGLVAKRLALDLTPLPTGEDGAPQQFHITCAVRSAQTVQTEADRQRSAVMESLLH